MNSNGIIALVVLVFIIVAAVGVARRWNADKKERRAIEFARIVSYAGTSAAVGIGGLILAIFCFESFIEYSNATTVFQQIAALLLWIGGNTFCGILIIAGMLGSQAKTYVVYSDLAARMESNIARLEKLQEQASSVDAVADAINMSNKPLLSLNRESLTKSSQS